MPEYLNTQFDWDDPVNASVHDELPLWSAPFGQILLEKIPLKPGAVALDIAFGTGFPLLELAQRLGPSADVYGIDPWKAAFQRVQLKIEKFNIRNVTLVEGDASDMAFADNMFDLVVSNTGINNFEDPGAVLQECFRVMKPGAVIALSTNPAGHMEEFYRVLRETMEQLELLDRFRDKLEAHIAHRHTTEAIADMLKDAGFVLNEVGGGKDYVIRCADGTAFLNHSFIRAGFMDGWKGIFPKALLADVFTALEANLNQHAAVYGEWRVTVPVAYIEGERPPSNC